MYCKICGSGLPVPTRQNPLYSKLTQDRPKAVVFDLDMTLFNNSQRFTDARRAGLVDKEGKAVVKRLSSKEKARNKRNKFLYSQKELAKDVVIPGATQLVSDLKNDDYTIIYLTARPAKYQEQTIKQLESKGFPLFRDMNGKPLVFSKPASRTQVPAFKGNKVRELLGNYKIEMVFDDDKRNLTEISKLSIPGLYASISDHVKHNPSHGEFDYVAKKGPKGPFVTSDLAKPDIDKAYDAMLERDGDPDNRPSTVGDTAYLEEERMKQMSIEDFLPDDFPIGPKALPNPLPKPKRKKLSNGKYRKEPKKTYADRMMNKNKKMKTDFPDRKQRYAVTMTLVEKFYGKPVKKNAKGSKKFKIHVGDIAGTKKGSVYATVQVGRNIVMDVGEGIQDVYRGLIGGRQSMTEKRMAMSIAEMEKDLMDQAKKLGANAVANLQVDYEPLHYGQVTILATGEAIKTRASAKKNPSHNSCPAVTQNLEMNTRNRNSAIKADYIQYGPLNLADEDYWVKAAEHWDTTPEVAKESNCSNCVAFDISPRMLECMPGSVQDDGQLGMCWMHNFKCHSARTCYTWAAGGPITEDSVSYDWQERSGAVKTNPAHPSKVEKAKKLYKHMNGKAPAKIEKKKLDLGDVWYQVGEGGCWQIGYISGKDNGRDDQKYTHVFNEETKDGNFPKLYATMPEKGKPMLIITGGTWKIKTDSEGVAWIYD